MLIAGESRSDRESFFGVSGFFSWDGSYRCLGFSG